MVMAVAKLAVIEPAVPDCPSRKEIVDIGDNQQGAEGVTEMTAGG